jgi:hypothetical protein
MPTKLPLNYFKLGQKLLKDGTTSTKWVRNFINLHEIKLQKWAIVHRRMMCSKFIGPRNNNRYHLMLLPIYLKVLGTENCAKSTENGLLGTEWIKNASISAEFGALYAF